MSHSIFQKDSSPAPTEAIIAKIRAIRDQRVDSLLTREEVLMSLLEAYYDTVAVSATKKEFMRRNLLELRASSLDLVHYSALITEVRKNPATLIEDTHPLFVQELKNIFTKYNF